MDEVNGLRECDGALVRAVTQYGLQFTDAEGRLHKEVNVKFEPTSERFDLVINVPVNEKGEVVILEKDDGEY